MPDSSTSTTEQADHQLRDQLTAGEAISKHYETGTPPEGNDIRYLSEEKQPEPAELLAALADHRHGSRCPKTIYPAGTAVHG